MNKYSMVLGVFLPLSRNLLVWIQEQHLVGAAGTMDRHATNPATSSSELQCTLTTEDIAVGRPVVCRLGRPAVVLISVCSQNQPEETRRDERETESSDRKRKNNIGSYYFCSIPDPCWNILSEELERLHKGHMGESIILDPQLSLRRGRSHIPPLLITSPLIFVPPPHIVCLNP